VFIPRAGVLLAGDMLSDIEVPLLDLLAADPIGDYRAGLDLLTAGEPFDESRCTADWLRGRHAEQLRRYGPE
jgi:hypothetical protein